MSATAARAATATRVTGPCDPREMGSVACVIGASSVESLAAGRGSHPHPAHRRPPGAGTMGLPLDVAAGDVVLDIGRGFVRVDRVLPAGQRVEGEWDSRLALPRGV